MVEKAGKLQFDGLRTMRINFNEPNDTLPSSFSSIIYALISIIGVATLMSIFNYREAVCSFSLCPEDAICQSAKRKASS